MTISLFWNVSSALGRVKKMENSIKVGGWCRHRLNFPFYLFFMVPKHGEFFFVPTDPIGKNTPFGSEIFFCRKNFCFGKYFGPTFFWLNWVQSQLRYYWNGHMLPGQMSQLAFVKDCPKNLSLKFGQNRASNSWDIADMDKCSQDKCCQDKCQSDSWNLL